MKRRKLKNRHKREIRRRATRDWSRESWRLRVWGSTTPCFPLRAWISGCIAGAEAETWVRQIFREASLPEPKSIPHDGDPTLPW